MTFRMWNLWSKQDKIDIERLAFGVERHCCKCEGPLPQDYDLDQAECRPCRQETGRPFKEGNA